MHVGELMRDDGTAEMAELDARMELVLILRRFVDDAAAHAPGRWSDLAACKGHADLMFPERGQPAAPGKALCASCPVFEPCARWAEIAPAEQQGIIAGTSYRERQRARAKLRAA